MLWGRPKLGYRKKKKKKAICGFSQPGEWDGEREGVIGSTVREVSGGQFICAFVGLVRALMFYFEHNEDLFIDILFIE